MAKEANVKRAQDKQVFLNRQIRKHNCKLFRGEEILVERGSKRAAAKIINMASHSDVSETKRIHVGKRKRKTSQKNIDCSLDLQRTICKDLNSNEIILRCQYEFVKNKHLIYFIFIMKILNILWECYRYTVTLQK